MMEFHISKIETNRALLLVSGELVNMESFVLKYSCEERCVGRQVSLYLLTEAGVVCRLQIWIILYWPIHRMAIGQVQQVAKPAAGAVPPLIADAVLQDDVVGAEGAQQAVHVLGRPLRIDLVNRFGSLPQAAVLEVRVVGQRPSCAQLDSGQQLHAPRKHSCPRGVRVNPVHQLHCIWVMEFSQLGELSHHFWPELVRHVEQC